MHSLRQSQASFNASLGDIATDWPARHDVGDGVAADARFNTYRGSIQATLCDALAAIYPVVARLVDVRFFRQTARQYLRAYPLASGDLRGFGGDFPQFLASLRALQELPFVPDVARLEWALNQVEQAPEDTHQFDVHRFGCLGDADWPRLRFQLHRATALVASLFPLLSIWEAHQGRTMPRRDVDLDAGGVQLLVARTSERNVGARELSVGEYTLLQAFAVGRALEDAHRQVMLVDPGFDLARALAQFIEQGVLTGFRPDVLLDLT
jgi:hypothetical protein